MKVIYVGAQKESYNPRRGTSFEYNNFYLTLKNMKGVHVTEYPFDLILNVGKRGFNSGLLELVRQQKPDLVFVFMFSDEIDKQTLLEIKKLTKSVAWFADDSWRFYNYSRYLPPYFGWVVTTYSWIPAFYEKLGYKNVIRSQWGANPNVWRPLEIKKDINVSFVGQRNLERAKVIQELRNAGIDVFVRGWGWPEGKASQEDLIKIVSRSRINLNINSQPSLWDPKSLARLAAKRSGTKIVPDFHFLDNFRSWLHIGVPQVKARPFELGSCRAFIISGFADDLDKFYKENEEMVFYRSLKDLIEKIKYYLPKDAEREKIAGAGYARTLRDHIYEKRFRDIFRVIGLN